MQHWTTLTPDGRRLVVTREGGVWRVACGEGDEARSELLDVALIEAIRENGELPGHSDTVDYASWTRALADRFVLAPAAQPGGHPCSRALLRRQS